MSPVLLICMGVSGSGKTTVAKQLAGKFEMGFFEADDFHSPANRARMASGKALTDAMREPWIDSICAALTVEFELGRNCILAYSGLRRSHRQRFRELGFKTLFLYLHGEKSLIAGRIQSRQSHFMPGDLLDSQFNDMDPTDGESDVVILDIDAELPLIIRAASELVRPVIGLL